MNDFFRQPCFIIAAYIFTLASFAFAFILAILYPVSEISIFSALVSNYTNDFSSEEEAVFSVGLYWAIFLSLPTFLLHIFTRQRLITRAMKSG